MNDGIRFDPEKEQAWLYRVARNKCFNVLKRQKKLAAIQPPATPTTKQDWEFIELIDPLTAEEQEIVALKIIGGFSHKEIAKIIGISSAAAKKRYERAIQKLRDEMEVFR